MTASATEDTAVTAGERADLLEILGQARHFLRFTARDLTDEQARQRTTVSELTLGGLIKHVAKVERGWTSFILNGPSVMPATTSPFSATGCCRTRRWKACWPATPRWRGRPTSS